MRSAMERGKWVFFQNCHLAPSWMPSLERLVENIDPDKVNGLFGSVSKGYLAVLVIFTFLENCNKSLLFGGKIQTPKVVENALRSLKILQLVGSSSTRKLTVRNFENLKLFVNLKNFEFHLPQKFFESSRKGPRKS